MFFFLFILFRHVGIVNLFSFICACVLFCLVYNFLLLRARVFNLIKFCCEFCFCFLFRRFRLRCCSPRSDLLAFVANEKLKLIEHFYREANVCMALRKQRQTPENKIQIQTTAQPATAMPRPATTITTVTEQRQRTRIQARDLRRRCRRRCRCRGLSRSRCRCRRRCRRSCVNYAIYCRCTVERSEMFVLIIFS